MVASVSDFAFQMDWWRGRGGLTMCVRAIMLCVVYRTVVLVRVVWPESVGVRGAAELGAEGVGM